MVTTSDLQKQHPTAQSLPTMYDLPSENPEEPGLPDEFHDFQPQLLSATFRLAAYPKDQIFTAADLNLYYDPNHLEWYKRPDWFAVLGVPRFYQGKDLRLSYVPWDETVNPTIVVELLSPGTAKNDLGEAPRKPNAPPTKWEVYEQILQIPHYIVYDRYSKTFRRFQLTQGHYQELEVIDQKLWIAELDIGLGIWHGSFNDISRDWLRWFTADGTWIPTKAEAGQQKAEAERQRAEVERQKAEAERQRAEAERRKAAAERRKAEAATQKNERLAAKLRELGIDPDQI